MKITIEICENETLADALRRLQDDLKGRYEEEEDPRGQQGPRCPFAREGLGPSGKAPRVHYFSTEEQAAQRS